MRKGHKDVIAGTVVAAISIIYLVASFSLDTLVLAEIGPEFFPRIIAGVLLVCSAVLILSGVRTARLGVEAPKTHAPENSPDTHKAVYTIVLLTSYILLMGVVGFVPASALYLFFQMVLLAPEGEKKYRLFAVISLVCSIAVYFVFRYGFSMILPLGIFRKLRL